MCTHKTLPHVASPGAAARVPGRATTSHSLVCVLAPVSHTLFPAAGSNGHEDRRMLQGEYWNVFSHEFIPNLVRNDG